MLPALRWAVERGDAAAVTEQLEAYERVLERLDANARTLGRLVGS